MNTSGISRGGRPIRSSQQLTGILIPCFHVLDGKLYTYKLGTDSDDYYLSMGTKLTAAATHALWEEVIVRGHFNSDQKVFVVERLILAKTEEPMQVPVRDYNLDIDIYRRVISQRGKLEPATEYLAS